jgi:pimeloyl-ACP methyl ester carboxylesterase
MSPDMYEAMVTGAFGGPRESHARSRLTRARISGDPGRVRRRRAPAGDARCGRVAARDRARPGRIPGAVYRELPGTPHMRTLSKPDLVAEALAEFLPASGDREETRTWAMAAWPSMTDEADGTSDEEA